MTIKIYANSSISGTVLELTTLNPVVILGASIVEDDTGRVINGDGVRTYLALVALIESNKRSRHSMIMPQFTAEHHLVFLKAGLSVSHQSNSANFFGQLQNNWSQYGFETAAHPQSANTLEQTIVETGAGHEGVLAHVMCGGLSGTGDITIRVTADGEVHTFLVEGITNSRRFCIGDFVQFSPSTDSNLSTGEFSAFDAGYQTTRPLGMVTPNDTASKGMKIGIPFEDSLKVTMQGSVNFNVGSSSNKSVAVWLTHIPQGVL